MGKIHLSIRELVLNQLDALWEMDEDAVVEWIHKKWPHGIGLYK